MGGAGARLPVLSVLDQPLLAAVVGDEARHVLNPQAVPAHTSGRQRQPHNHPHDHNEGPGNAEPLGALRNKGGPPGHYRHGN